MELEGVIKLIGIFVLQFISLYLWFVQWWKNAGRMSRIYWTVSLIGFWGLFDLLTLLLYVNSVQGGSSPGIVAAGLIVMFGVPLSLFGLLLLIGVIVALAYVSDAFIKNKGINPLDLPGPNWLWFLIVGVITTLLFYYGPQLAFKFLK